MNKTEHMRKRIARQSELLRERFKGLKRDPDIWNLEYMITEIGYGSFAWRSGQIRTLRRAIRALERENKERGDQ